MATANKTMLSAAMADVTGVAKMHGEYGITGRGVKIGIIDSGVDWSHPLLGGCFGPLPSCTVQYGYDFVGDFYGDEDGGTLTPDSDPKVRSS
jgi:subtilisin family serine protease